MQSAIRDIAPQVGNSWPEIYMKLPFLPPRQAKKLESDIQGTLLLATVVILHLISLYRNFYLCDRESGL